MKDDRVQGVEAFMTGELFCIDLFHVTSLERAQQQCRHVGPPSDPHWQRKQSSLRVVSYGSTDVPSVKCENFWKNGHKYEVVLCCGMSQSSERMP